MSSQRLLKRMALWQQAKNRTHTEDETDQILLDVEKLLSVQRGNVLIDEEMGLPDLRTVFHSQVAPDIESLGRQIQQQISQYEPRLEKVEIISEEEDRDHQDGLHWLMKAEHVNRAGDWFEAEIKVDVIGNITVRAKK